MKTKLSTQIQAKTNRWIFGCISTLIALLLLGSATINAPAQQIISFDILAGTLADHNVMDPINDFAGAPGVWTNYWNMIGNYLNGGTGTADVTLPTGSVSITNSAGQIVPNLQVTIHTAGDGYANRNTSASGGDAKMQSDIIDCARGFSAGYNLGYIDFTNIPYTNYNIYCYTLTTEAGSGATKTRGGFWIITNTPNGIQRIYNRSQSNDVAYTQIPALTIVNATNGGYVRATTTSIPGGGTSWDSINGGNYGVFTGLTNSHTRVYFGALSTSSQKDDLGNWVNPATGGDTNPRFKQAGFQIVQVLPIAATPTNIAFIGGSPTNLLLGSTFTFPLSMMAKYNDGTSNDVTLATGIGYISGNTNIFTVSGSGLISPGQQAGVTNLVASFTGSWGTLYATNFVTVLAPTSLNIVLDRTNLFVGKNGVIDFTLGHLFAGFNDPLYTNVNVTAFHGAYLSSLTPSIISVANGLITAINVGNFGINASYGSMSVNFNPAGTAQYFIPVGNPGISMKLTDSLPPSSHAMTFRSLAGVPGGEVNAPNVTGLGARLPYWNNLVIPNGRSFPTNSIGVTNAVLDSGGNIVSNLVAVFAAPTAAGIAQSGSPTTNESLLFDTYFDNGLNDSTQPTTANAGFIIVSNVPYAHYDVYVYVQDDGSSRAGQFTCEGQSFVRANYGSALVPANDGTGYYEAIDTVLPTPSSPIAIGSIDPGNTIHFQNITNSTLTVNFAACATNTVTGASYPNTIPRLRLVGFQIVEQLDGLTATNLYLSQGVPSLTINGIPYSLKVLANFSDGTLGGIVTTLPGIRFSSDNTSIFTVDARGVITPGATIGAANLTVNYTNSTDNSVVTLTTPVTTQAAVSTSPVTMNVTSGGGNLNFSWPSDHLGWRLVTNSVGLNATYAWFTYPGSSSVTNITVPIGTSGNVYFRLTYP